MRDEPKEGLRRWPTPAAEIGEAWTPVGAVYGDPLLHAAQVERIFARSWQLVPEAAEPPVPGAARPFTLLAGSLDEPLVLVTDEGGERHCMSNVCTHRANLVVEQACQAKTLRCRYHGRRFALDGHFLSMPEFEGVRDFPSGADDLARLPLASWGPLGFTAIDPALPAREWLAPLRERLSFLPLDEFRLDPAGGRDYEIEANWMLYCDNFLEGFHIPFVHHGLAAVIDYGSYRTETFEHGSLQLGMAAGEDPVFSPPSGHRDAQERIAAYYFWLFPNLMLNFYPWGLSANVVEPLGPTRTRVRFLVYVWREALRQAGAGADLHRVELEDEAIVEAVQRGVRSRLYRRGRYSPAREAGVHHFHRLLGRALGEVVG